MASGFTGVVATVMLENYTWYLFMLFMLIAMRSHNFVSHIKYVDIKKQYKINRKRINKYRIVLKIGQNA